MVMVLISFNFNDQLGNFTALPFIKYYKYDLSPLKYWYLLFTIFVWDTICIDNCSDKKLVFINIMYAYCLTLAATSLLADKKLFFLSCVSSKHCPIFVFQLYEFEKVVFNRVNILSRPQCTAVGS